MTTTYRYVSDGSLVGGMHRDGLARLLNPWLVSALVLFCLGFGVVLSLITYETSLPTYLGKVLLIGLFWGALELLAVVVCAAVLIPATKLVSTRVLARNYAPGLVTEVELEGDALVLRRPTGTRTIPYVSVAQVKRRRGYLTLALRGSLRPIMLPPDLLPKDALAYVRTRARGQLPASVAAPPADEPTRRFVVPVGWDAHLAALHVRSTATSRGFWTRVVLSLAIAGVVAGSAGWGWLLLAPAFALLSLGVTYGQARHGFGTAVPPGTEATTEFLADRFISRNYGGVREIRYSDVRSVRVRGDVVVLEVAGLPGVLMLARALVPDEGLARLRHKAPA